MPEPPYHASIIGPAGPCHSFAPAIVRLHVPHVPVTAAGAGLGYVQRIHWLKSLRKGCRSDLAKPGWVVEYEKLSTFMPCSRASTSPRFLDRLFSTSGKRGLPVP